MKKLAIGFPGMHYTCREPLMERLFSLYRERGHEILPLDYSPIPFREMDSFPQFLAAAEERTDILLEKVASAKLYNENADSPKQG